MKTAFLAAGSLLALVSAASAQSVITTTTRPDGSSQTTVESYDPSTDSVVRQYISRAPAPVVEEHMTLRPGSTVPTEVPLQAFSSGPASLSRYGYFVSVDNKIVVVDPASRVVVRILDKTG